VAFGKKAVSASRMRLEIGAKKKKEKVNNFMGSASKTTG